MQPYFIPFDVGKFAMIDLGSAQSISLIHFFHGFLSVGRFSETGAEAEADAFVSLRRVAFRLPLDSSALFTASSISWGNGIAPSTTTRGRVLTEVSETSFCASMAA
jgi:hypothetical protein